MLKIGIIGSGFGLYGLLPAFNSTKGCKVVSICGKKTDRLVKYCQSIGLEKIYTDWQTMLDTEKLDAVAIAVVPNVQYEIVKTTIAKGLHVFAEKPLTTTYPQAKELFTLSQKKKIKNMVDFLFPEIEEWKKVKELLAQKKLGDLQQIYLNWDFLSYDIKNKRSSWKTDVAEGGGALSLYFCHSLYYLEYFAGKIINLKSLLTYSNENINGGEIGVDILFKFKNEIIGYAHLCCNVRGLSRHQLIFSCQKGTIVLENKDSITSNFSIKIYIDDKVQKILTKKEESIKNNEDERVRIVKKLASRFVNSIIYNKKVTPSFKEGLRVQELIEKIRNDSL